MRRTTRLASGLFPDVPDRERAGKSYSPSFEIVKHKYSGSDGWAKTYNLERAMPGIGDDTNVSADITMKHTWFNEMRIPNGPQGSAMPRMPRRRHLSGGPVGGMLDTINDSAGFPTSTNLSKAAAWKVERLARVDPRYELTKQPVTVPSKKPPPLGIQPVCSPGTRRPQSNRWNNFLTNVRGSNPDPLVRDASDQRTFPPRLSESIDKQLKESRTTRNRTLAGKTDRPWEKTRDSMAVDEEPADVLNKVFRTDSFNGAMRGDATAVWIFGWVNEWETQIKIACPWDNRLYVHRSSAELPWVLEQQWNAPEVARDLTRDCIEDFQEMFQKKGYMKGVEGKMKAVVCINGFWHQRRGIVQGLNEMRDRVQYLSMSDTTPIPVDEVELMFPAPQKMPGIALFQLKMKAEDHQAHSINTPRKVPTHVR